MHRAARPAVLGRSLALLFALCAEAPVAPAQEGAFRGWDSIGDANEEFRFNPDASEVATFAIQTSAEVRHRFQSALAAMQAGNFGAAREPLQDVIALFPNHLYQVAEKPARWVGGGEYARYLLSTFPPEALGEYADWAALRIGGMDDSLLEGRQTTALEDLARTWVATPKGQRALEVLGWRALEAGQHEVAARLLRRRLAFDDPATDAGAEVAAAAAAALALGGDISGAEAVLLPYADRSIRVAGASVAAAAALDSARALAGPVSPRWPTFGGRPDHLGLAPGGDGPLAFGNSWTAPAFSRMDENPYGRRGADQEFPFHPVVADDTLVVADGLMVRAFSFFSREPRWSYAGPIHDVIPPADVVAFEDYRNQEGVGELGSLARSLHLLPLIAERRVIAPLIDATPSGRRIAFDNMPIVRPIPRRSLHALDLDTGRLLWRQRRPELGEQAFVNRVSIAAAPIAVGDLLLAPGSILEGAINCYMVAFSAATGDLVWKTPLAVGQQELTMFNKSFKEFSLQMAAESGGSVYVSTNLGLFACLDSLTGDIRWMTQYEALPIRGAQHYTRSAERKTPWNNDAPVVAGGVVIATPLDSEFLYAFDAATGKRLWRIRHDDQRKSYRYLLGVDQGAVVVSGVQGLGFYDLASGRCLNSVPYSGKSPYSMGRGCLVRGAVYQPLYDRLLELKWKPSGNGIEARDQLLDWHNSEPGNLLLYRDFQVSISQQQITVFFDVQALTARTRARVESGAPSCDDLVLLGDLEHLRQDYPSSLAAYERALAACAGASDVERRAADGLYRSHRELARIAAAANDRAALVRHLEQACERAPDDFLFLASAEQLLAAYDEQDRAGAESVLARIDQRCPEAEYPFANHRPGGLVKAGLFTLDTRARLALSDGRDEEAVGALQAIIERYRAEPYDGRTAGRYAEERIAALISERGPAVYERFERESRELAEAAERSRDAAALARVIESYPNARDLVGWRLRLARLRLDSGDSAGVFTSVAPLLSVVEDEVLRGEAMALLARGAEGAGDLQLALELWRRLARPDPRPAGSDGAALQKEAEAEAERLARAALPAAPIALATPPALTPRAFALELDLDTQVVAIQGRAAALPPSGVLLYQPARTGREPGGRLRLIDLDRMVEAWTAPVKDYFVATDPTVAFAIGGALLVRQGSQLAAYSPSDGSLRYRKDLPAMPRRSACGRGLWFGTWEQRDGRFAVVAIEPATGGELWRRELPQEVLRLEVLGEHLLVAGRDSFLEALDVLSGVTENRVSLLEIYRGVGVAAFEEFGVAVAVGMTEKTAKYGTIAFDGADGRRLWSNSAAESVSSASCVLPFGDKIALIRAGVFSAGRPLSVQGIRVVEPRSGAVAGEVSGLKRMKLFDEGPVGAGGRAVLVEPVRGAGGGRSSQKHDRLVALDLGSGAVAATAELDQVPGEFTSYRAFASADGKLFGTVDVNINSNRARPTFVFVFDPATGALEHARVPATDDLDVSSCALVAGGLAVLKDDKLYLYPSGGVR